MNKGRMRNGVNCKMPCLQCRAVIALNRASLNPVSRLCFVGPSRQITNLIKTQLNIPHARCEHIPNPNSYMVNARIRKYEGHGLTFGYIGRLEPDKGVKLLLKTMDEVATKHKLRFLIAGAGSLKAEVAEFCAVRPWATFLGFVQPDQVGKTFDEIDYLLLPSLWAENFPGSAVQAISAGTPVIGFDIGGISEIVLNDVCGLTVPAGDGQAFAEAIEIVIKEPDRLERYSNGALSAARRYDPDLLFGRLRNIMLEMICTGENMAQTTQTGDT
jgi:glycosyltransferase involved in cell wall biosynthesis